MIRYFAVLLLSAACPALMATETFQFVSDGETLALLELRQLPAKLDSFVSLSFTEKGQDIFGFGPVYTGDFDASGPDGQTSGPRFVLSEIDGGLTGFNADGVEAVSFSDTDPPPSEVFDQILIFSIGARDPAFGLHDTIGLLYRESPDFVPVFNVRGAWLPVPEPTGVYLLLVIAFGILHFARIRRTS